MSVSEFNNTLFELTDEMVKTVEPSAIMMTAYSVFKQTLAADPNNALALDAFWDIAKDQGEMIRGKDVNAMADVLRSIIPMPGMVDDVLGKLSEENRGIVGDYVAVLYDQASAIKSSGGNSESTSLPADSKEAALPIVPPPKEESDATVYLMYNDVWKEFLVLALQASKATKAKAKGPTGEVRGQLQQALDKLTYVLGEKGSATSMVFGVLAPCLSPVLPKGLADDTDILGLCMPPSQPIPALEKDMAALGTTAFPFCREMPFSAMLDTVKKCSDKETRTKVATYWHYIKLLTLCLQECPPEVAGMMNQIAAMFRQDPGRGMRFLREQTAVLTK